MKNIPALLLFFLASQYVFSQNTTRSTDLISFKVTPTSVFNPNVSTILFAAEVRPVNKIGIQFEYGLQFNELALLNWNHEKKDWQYAKYRGEVRWYPELIEEVSFFGGAGLLLIPQRYTKAPGFVFLDGVEYSYESSRISKDAWVVLLNFGAKWHVSRHFFTEFYSGFGYKKLTIRHQPVGLVEDRIPFREWFTQRDEREGTWNLPFLDFGVKLGVSLGKSGSSKSGN